MVKPNCKRDKFNQYRGLKISSLELAVNGFSGTAPIFLEQLFSMICKVSVG